MFDSFKYIFVRILKNIHYTIKKFGIIMLLF